MTAETRHKIRACVYMIKHHTEKADEVFQYGNDLSLIYFAYDYHMQQINHYELMLEELI